MPATGPGGGETVAQRHGTKYAPSAPLDPCVPKSWLRVLDLALAVTAAGVLMYAVYSFNSVTGDADPDVKREKMRIIAVAVSTLGVLAWPVLWQALAGFSLITHHPLTLFGFIWPMVMCLLDLSYASAAKNAVMAEKVFGIGQLSADANSLIGVAFAVGSLLCSQSSVVADSTVPLLMYALLLLIAFIVPTPSLDPSDYSGFLAGSVQRIFFNYAMGFVISGISLNVSGQTNSGLNSALRRICMRKSDLLFSPARSGPAPGVGGETIGNRER